MTHGRSKPLHPWRAALVAGLVAALPHTGSAITQVSASAQTASNPYGAGSDQSADAGGAGQAVQASAFQQSGGPIFSSVPPFPAVGSQSGEASAHAHAAEGTLRAEARSQADTAPLVQNAMQTVSLARASWSDGIVVDAGSSLQGLQGTVTAALAVDGTLGGTIGPNGPADSSSVDVTARLLGTGLSPLDPSTIPARLAGECGGWALCARQYSGFGFFDGEFTVSTVTFSNFTPVVLLTIPVTFGSPTTLTYTLDVSVDAQAASFADGLGTASTGASDYSRTVLWAGITGVFGPDGQPLADFSVTSTSGFDYRMAVPEPGTGALLAASLALLGLAKRRRA
jgi:hypothetical protein